MKRKFFLYSGFLMIALVFIISFRNDGALHKGLDSVRVVETMQPINDTEMNFLFKVAIKNQTDADLTIEWVEPVFQGVIAKKLENVDLKQQASNVLKNNEMIIANEVKFLYQQGETYETGNNIAGVNIKLMNGKTLYIEV
ncbi:hypothetical protein [Gorillibacterium sp. CAU 1737]|uniref:hypothetical protein n=1 Tax=Gorillibacterium sp. CAU 1737 TaxID=3140362 RepID=UPI0032612E75